MCQALQWFRLGWGRRGVMTAIASTWCAFHEGRISNTMYSFHLMPEQEVFAIAQSQHMDPVTIKFQFT